VILGSSVRVHAQGCLSLVVVRLQRAEGLILLFGNLIRLRGPFSCLHAYAVMFELAWRVVWETTFEEVGREM